MRFPRPIAALIILSLPVLLGPCHARAANPRTWLHLADGSTGREIALVPLTGGEEVVLTWRNSLFNLMVREKFIAEAGRLVLTQVVYEDPRGLEPPLAGPEDVEDLVQTGGPFRVTGISKPFTRIVFRIGEIGRPRLKIGERVVDFAREVGFGGSVIMTIRSGP